MIKTLVAQALTQEAFAPYGDVIQKLGSENFQINNGNCTRHHALGLIDVEGDAAISIFSAMPYPLPHIVDLVERHPLGSQAFYPLGTDDWLVVVCEDDGGTPKEPCAFLATGDQGINLKKGQWHGVLTPLYRPSDFLVVDRRESEGNLEEFVFPEHFAVSLV